MKNKNLIKKGFIITLCLAIGISSISGAALAEEFPSMEYEKMVDNETDPGIETMGEEAGETAFEENTGQQDLETDEVTIEESSFEGIEENPGEPEGAEEDDSDEKEMHDEAGDETEEEYSDVVWDEAEFEADFIVDEVVVDEPMAQDLDTGVFEGTCGKNGADVRWRFENGVMTISGSGAMDDFNTSSNKQPWLNIRNGIKEVVVENGVTQIGVAAFLSCFYLEKVTIADSVTCLCQNSFSGCMKLTDINLGSGIQKIEANAFYSSSATSITLPKNVSDLSDSAFSGMSKLENIYVQSGNSIYQSKDGVLCTDQGTTLLLYPIGRSGAYYVPAGVKKIVEYAFAESNVTSLTFADSVTEIGNYAFFRCKGLTAITFPKNLKVIPGFVCMGCTNLTSVTIPEGVTTIEVWAFEDCTALKTVTIPSTVTTIDRSFADTVTIKTSQNSLYRQEDGSYVDAVQVNLYANENYQKAFQVLNLVNQERTKEGKDPLVMDQGLLETAMQRAAEIVLYWSHTRPSGSACISANKNMFGENIARGYYTAEGTMSQWMNSSGHRANILHNSFKSIGIGCVEYNGSWYWVQCFGTIDGTAAKASSYSDGTKKRVITVKKEEEYYSADFDLKKKTLQVGESTSMEVLWSYDELRKSGAVAESSDPKVCQVDGEKILAVGTGTAVITMYFPGYKERAVSKKVTVTEAGVATAGSIKVTYNANGGSVSAKSKNVFNGKTYGTLAAPTRRNYSFTGWYTAKTGGTKVTSSTKVTKKSNHTLYAHWKKVSVNKASISKLTKKTGGAMTVKLNKCTGAKGYQIICAADAKFTKNKKTVNTTTLTKNITGLRKGKIWYVKVRAYKKDSAGKRVYGAFSTKKKIRL